MPRPLRYEAIDLPQHVIQRGNNRQATFFAEEDYEIRVRLELSIIRV